MAESSAPPRAGCSYEGSARTLTSGDLPLAPVPEDLARRIAAGQGGHATARVGRRAALVETLERRPVVGVAGRRAHMEELVEGQLAVEDVAADQAVLVLHVVRADH